MAIDLGGGQGGPKSDINVTPLVDVMLVLLIIMMIMAPMLQRGVDVRLPVAANTVDKPETQEQTVVAVDAQNQTYLNSIPTDVNDLGSRAQEILEAKTEKIVLIKADEDASYSAVMQAMDELREAGIENMGLVTEPRAKPGEEEGAVAGGQ